MPCSDVCAARFRLWSAANPVSGSRCIAEFVSQGNKVIYDFYGPIKLQEYCVVTHSFSCM